MASVLAGAIDPSWSLPLNTVLLIVLAIMNKRTHRSAQDAKNRAIDAMEVAADTRRIVKEAHNASMDAMEDKTQRILARKYKDSPDPASRRFEPNDPEDSGLQER